MKTTLLLTLALAATPAAQALAQEATAPAPSGLIVFGDGLSDTGNAFDQSLENGAERPASPPYFDGRFSDGPLWVEVVASRLRLPAPAPSARGGRNYAWGGATAGAVGEDGGAPGLGQQVDAFLGTGARPGPGDVIVIWAGADDFFACDFAVSSSIPDPAALVGSIAAQISNLASQAGSGAAPRFLVANLPPIGQTARARWLGEHVDAELPLLLDRLTAQFNAHLAAELRLLESRLGIDVLLLDVDGLTREILASPSRFGFQDVAGTARQVAAGSPPPEVSTEGNAVAGNASGYVFFDAVHPTAAWHDLVGQQALSLLSEQDASDGGR